MTKKNKDKKTHGAANKAAITELQLSVFPQRGKVGSPDVRLNEWLDGWLGYIFFVVNLR